MSLASPHATGAVSSPSIAKSQNLFGSFLDAANTAWNNLRNIGSVIIRSMPFRGPLVSSALSAPTESGAVVDSGQDSLTLPSGGQIYLYGLTTGGAYPSNAFTNGEYASVTDADGNLVAALAYTIIDTNSYTTQAAYYTIGGVSVSGYSSMTPSYGDNPNSGATSASDTFTVSAADSLVIVIAIGGDEQCISVLGVPGFTVDASNSNSAGLPNAITIGQATPTPATYTVTEQTTQCAAGQDPNHAGDLIGVFVFAPVGTTGTGSCASTTVAGSSASSSNPAIGDSQAFPQQSSLSLASGGEAYVYGFSDGGRYPTTGFQNGELFSCTVSDAVGNIADGIAVTTSDSNSYSTSDSAYSIVGAEVSGYSSFTSFEGDSGSNPDATTASVTFTVTSANSLTVIVALASGQSNLILSGATLSIAAESVVYPGGTDPVEIAYASLSPGTYTITETTAPTCTNGCEIGAATDMMGAFVFAPASISQTMSLTDYFNQDNSLDTNLWTYPTSILDTMATETSQCPGNPSCPSSAYENPQLSFSASGMDMQGGVCCYTFTGIQSVNSFSYPLEVKAEVTMDQSYGGTFELTLVNSEVSSYIRVIGNALSDADFRGIFAIDPAIGFNNYGSSAILDSSPSTGVPYIVDLTVDSTGYATVTLEDSGGTVIGSQSNLFIGSGTDFYLVLAQSEGSPPTTGPNEATWNYVTLTSSGGGGSGTPISSCPTGGGISANSVLTADIFCSQLTIDSGVTLTTNGFSIIVTGSFVNDGTITSGFPNNGGVVVGGVGGSYPNSYGGSGGGGGFNAGGGGAGGATLVGGGAPGTAGIGNGPGQNGGTPSSPSLTNALIESMYSGGMINYLSGGGGGAGQPGAGQAPQGDGGSGAFGVYIQANSFTNDGTITATGQTAISAPNEPNDASGGGGGGGVIIIAYGSGGFTAGTQDVSGGNGGYQGAGSTGGNGGVGQILSYNYGDYPPIGGSTPPTCSSTGSSSSPSTIPSGIEDYVPITIDNCQAVATPSPFQQMIEVDSTTYSTYEAANLQNVEFFASDGSIIPSWLESGPSSSSTNTVYWLNLPGGIAADSSSVIYLGFGSTSSSLLNSQTTGEAPQLSPSYAQYDDGSNVFTSYWNFAGTSLPSGWQVSTTGQPQTMIYHQTDSSSPILVHVIGDDGASDIGSRINVGVSTSDSFTSIGYSYELYPSINYGGQDGEQYVSNSGWGLYSINSGGTSTFLYSAFPCNSQVCSSVSPIDGYDYVGAGFSNGYATALYSDGTSIDMKTLTQSDVSFSSTNYIWISTDIAGLGTTPTGVITNNGVELEAGNNTPTYGDHIEYILIYAAAVSEYPPNGVMPSVSFGRPASTTSSTESSSSSESISVSSVTSASSSSVSSSSQQTITGVVRIPPDTIDPSSTNWVCVSGLVLNDPSPNVEIGSYDGVPIFSAGSTAAFLQSRSVYMVLENDIFTASGSSSSECGGSYSGQYMEDVSTVGQLSLVPSTATLTFTETGLSSGDTWSVSLNSYEEQTTTNSLAFQGIALGTYTYSVKPPTGFMLQPNNAATTIYVSGSETISLTFVLVPTVFTEPSTTSFEATIDSSTLTAESTLNCPAGETNLEIQNTGNTQLSWSVTDTNDLLSSTFTPSSGTTPVGQTTEVKVQIASCVAASTISDTIEVSATGATNQNIPITINFATNSGSSTTSSPYEVTTSLSESSGSYTIQFAIIPQATIDGGYIMLTQAQANSLVDSLISQLGSSTNGLTTTNAEGIVGVFDNSVFGQSGAQLITDLFQCPTAIAQAISTGGISLVGLGISQIVLDHGKVTNNNGQLSLSCGMGLPSAPQVVITEVDDEFTTISQSIEQELILPNEAQISSPSTLDKEVYVAGQGQEILIEISGLTGSPSSTVSLTFKGQNDYVGSTIPTPATCTVNGVTEPFKCYQASQGSFSVSITLTGTESCFLFFFNCTTSYNSPTDPFNDPVIPFLTATITEGQLDELSLDSASSTISAQILTASGSGYTDTSVSISIPVVLDPSDIPEFGVTINGASVPFSLVFVTGQGYMITFVTTDGGALLIQLPKISSSIGILFTDNTLQVVGGGFASNSPIDLEYWTGTSWASLATFETDSNGAFIGQVAAPDPISTFLFINAIDGSGDIASGAIMVSSSSSSPPTSVPQFPFGLLPLVALCGIILMGFTIARRNRFILHGKATSNSVIVSTLGPMIASTILTAELFMQSMVRFQKNQ